MSIRAIWQRNTTTPEIATEGIAYPLRGGGVSADDAWCFIPEGGGEGFYCERTDFLTPSEVEAARQALRWEEGTLVHDVQLGGTYRLWRPLAGYKLTADGQGFWEAIIVEPAPAAPIPQPEGGIILINGLVAEYTLRLDREALLCAA